MSDESHKDHEDQKQLETVDALQQQVSDLERARKRLQQELAAYEEIKGEADQLRVLRGQVESMETELRYLNRLSDTMSPEDAIRRIRNYREHPAMLAVISLIRHWRDDAIAEVCDADIPDSKRAHYAGRVEELARVEQGILEAGRLEEGE